MRSNRLIGLLVLSGLWACSSSDPARERAEDADPSPGAQAREFAASEPAPGYMRYYPEPIELEPGSSGQWAQWVAPALDTDMDVVDIRGDQNEPGHHSLLYSTPVAQVEGFTRPVENLDQLSTRFLGGVGGEGGEGVSLPKGVVFRVPAGHSLVMQSHYINPGDEPVMGRSYLDVQLAEPSDDAKVAVIFASGSLGLAVEPGVESSIVSSCELQRPLDVLMYANHMHETGVSVLTEATLPDGEQMELKRDDAWDYEWQTNPNYTRRSSDDPLHLPKGTRITTHCTWHNDGDETLRFPDEMCVFVAFIYGNQDINCMDGTWSGPED